jgi:hypothetical protein
MATEIAYKNGFTFIKRDFKIYKVTNNIEELFCEEDRPKKIWFQTWTKLKEQIEKDNNDIDFLNYLKNL